jgi:hypothetical protein
MSPLFVSAEEYKTKWAMICCYYRRAFARRKPTSGQASKAMKKWHFQER